MLGENRGICDVCDSCLPIRGDRRHPPLRQGGRYIIDLLDSYAAGWPYLFIGLMELLAMYWVYGVGKFYRDLENIQGFSPGLRLKSHMTVVYGTISPALISVRHLDI